MMINRTFPHQSDKFCFSLGIFKKKAMSGGKVTFQG